MSNLRVRGIATHHITRFGAHHDQWILFHAGVSKVGGKLTLSCTKGTLEQDRVNGFKITSVANSDGHFSIVFYKSKPLL